MFRNLRRCFKNIRKIFKPKNKEQNVEEPIENEDGFVEECDVPSFFERQTEKTADAECTSDPGMRGSTTSSKSSLSDPVEILPLPGTILIIVQEAKIKLEYTAEPTTAYTVVIHTKVQLDEEENYVAEGKVESDRRSLNEAAVLSKGFTDTLADATDSDSNARAILTVVEETKKPSGSKAKSRSCRFCRTLSKLFRCKKKQSKTDSVSSSDELSLQELSENEEQTEKEIESGMKFKEIEEKAEDAVIITEVIECPQSSVESMADSVSSLDQLSLEELTEDEEQSKIEIVSGVELKEIEEKAEMKTQELPEDIAKDTNEELDLIKVIEEQTEEKSESSSLESEVENPEDTEGTENAIITEVIECPSASSSIDAVQSSDESMKDRVPSPVQVCLEELTVTEEQTKEETESDIAIKQIEEKAEMKTQELPEDIAKDTDEEFDLLKILEEQSEEKSESRSLESLNPEDTEGTEDAIIITEVIECPSASSSSDAVQSSVESIKDRVPSPVQLSLEELTVTEEQTKEETESVITIKEIEEKAEIKTQELPEDIAKDTDEELDVIEEKIEEKSVSSSLESKVEDPEEYIAEAVPGPSLAAGCTVPVDEQEFPDKKEDSDNKTPDVAAELCIESLPDDERDPINITPIPGAMLIIVQEGETGAKLSISETSEELNIVKESGEVLAPQPEHLLQESQITGSTSVPENAVISAHPAQIEEPAERIETEGACAPQESPASTDQQMSRNSLDDFDFCKWIAKGSYGEVFLAEHKKTSKMVAIKRMEKTAIFNTETTECLFVEKSVLKMARDEKTPFLVGLVCTFQREHNVYLAMEFGVGGDLAAQLTNGALPLNSTLFYSACIVQGIKFLHDRSIVHRDLKPDNVLIDSRGYAKLADFGLCKTGIGYGDEMKYPCGTLQYMPPEMFTRKIYNRTTDWWALGVLIFQMAVGKLPFTGNRQELRENIVKKQPKYPGWLDYNTNGVIRAFLNKDNKARLGALENDGEQVMRHRYFKTMNWKALTKRKLKAPFIPDPYVKTTTATEDQKAGDAATPPEYMWPVPSEIQEPFREFDELIDAP